MDGSWMMDGLFPLTSIGGALGNAAGPGGAECSEGHNGRCTLLLTVLRPQTFSMDAPISLAFLVEYISLAVALSSHLWGDLELGQ
jgi:hypothetical protein